MSFRLSRTLLAVTAGLALAASSPSTATAQSATVITGRVTNSKTGEPIPSATVGIEATQIGVLTGLDGRFTLNIPAARTGNATLTARLIGFRMMRVNVTLNGARITQDFALVQQPAQLDEVVVTALSQQREKATIGTAQQTVSAEDLTKTQQPNLISAMSGKVAGLQISQSGNMGGSTRIVIRGASSILGENQPLFIIDGIPISNRGFSSASASGGRDYGSAISDINMDDVASLTVLKGPNAAALYGSRASNGAVVITTKSGRNQLRGVKFNFTSRATADQPSVLPNYQNQYGQGFTGEFNYVDGAGSGTNDGADESWGPKLDGRTTGCMFIVGQPGVYDKTKSCDQFTGKGQPWVAHPDNVSGYFRTGSTLSNNLNVTTSSDNAGGRLSITKDDIRGIVPNSSLSRLAGSLSANATFKEKLTLNASVQYTQNSGMNRPENGYTEGNPLMSFTWFGRQVDINAMKAQYYNQSSPYGFADGTLFGWNDNYHRNPWWQVFENPTPDSRDRVIAQLSANYEFAPWLSGVVRGGGDSFRFTAEEQFAKGNIDRADAGFNGAFTNNNLRSREANVEGLLTARKSVSRFDLTANVGGNTRRNDSYASSYGTRGILVPGIYNLANAGIAPSFSNSESHSAVNSVYGEGVLTTNGYWTVDVTGRKDYSSTLPKENAAYFYPSVSSSLVLSDLIPAIADNAVLSYLKIRGSWARVGSDAAPYQLATLYSGATTKFAGLPLYTLSNSSANSQLKPEQTTGKEAGLEFALFDDRLTFDATYYSKISRDQILNLTTAPATGFSSTVINAGQLSNKGYEFSATVRPIRSTTPTGLSWSSTFNFLKNNSMVDSLYPGLTTTTIASQWSSNIEARVGQPYGVLFGYAYARDSATGKRMLSGGLPYRNSVKQILGNVNPDWTGGWANELRYKAWSLNTLLDMRHGGQNFSVGNWWGQYAGILASTLEGREEDWDKPGLVIDGIDNVTKKPNTIRVTAEDYNHTVYPINEAGILNTGFVKLREVRLAWEAPQRFAAKVRASQLNIAFIGRNLKTWTDFPNYDPENASNAGNGAQGYDMGAMPTARSFGFNVSVTP
ncbi:MAG: SusC/RagA family TonB-linked outer membrane protein [Gemmatimonadota bacterium]